MAVPNLSEIATATIDNRSGVVADQVTANNAALTYFKKRGGIKKLDGGDNINIEISFQENGNAAWYSGTEAISVGQTDVLSSAQVQWKQLAAAVVISGLDQRKNRGEAKILDLLDARMEVAENTLANFVDRGIWGDGTSYGGRTITGMDAAVPTTVTSGTYAGIDRQTYTMWRSQLQDDSGAPSTTTIQPRMTTLYGKCVRGTDQPDLILFSQTYWGTFIGSLQALQRFVDAGKAELGFQVAKFLGADVVLAGGIGGTATDTNGTGYFLNTKYAMLGVHTDCNFQSLNPDKRYSINQDAMVVLIGWMGNMLFKGPQFCGRQIHH